MVREMRPLEYGSEYLDYEPFCEYLLGRGFQPYVVLIESQRAISNANREFSYVAGTATHLRVTTTGSHKKVDAISGSANDASSAAAHCQTVGIWGVDQYNALRVEEIDMSGTTASSSTNSYFEIGNVWCRTFGTGDQDAAGQIRIGYAGKSSNEVVEVTAGAVYGNSSRVPIPKYWRARILSAEVRPADADVALSSGVMVFPHVYDEYDMKVHDGSNQKVSVMRDGASLGPNVWPNIYGSDNTYSCLEFYGNRVKSSETWLLRAKVVMWGTESCSSNNKFIRGAP